MSKNGIKAQMICVVCRGHLTRQSFGRDYSVSEEKVDREIVPDGLHLMIRPSFMWRDGYWIGMVRFFNKNGAQVMRGFDPIARGMKRSDLTPMKVREYRGLLLNSSESISFLYSTRIPNTVIGTDHFGTRTWPTHGFYIGGVW
jgi:hypothetical protein